MFGFLLLVVTAVIIGLVIAYWYLRRLEDERRRLHRQPRVVPIPEKHRAVDLTPDASSVDALVDRTEADASADDAGEPTGHRDAIEPEQRPEAEAAPAQEAREAPPVPGADAGTERDDLKRISGIGPKLERVLNAHGVFRFRQIAEWQDADIDAIDEELGSFSGRIRRDDWVGQAKKLSD